MATEVIKTIKPAGGGDYSSLSAFDTGEQRDLVTADEVAVAECYSGGNLLSGGARLLLNSGTWVTDSTRNIVFRAATGEQHNGVWSTSFAYADGTTANEAVFIAASNDVSFEKLQLRNIVSTAAASCVRAQDAGVINYDRCLAIYETTSASGIAVLEYRRTPNGEIKNCAIIGTNGSGVLVAGLMIQGNTVSGLHTIYNSTITVSGGTTPATNGVQCRDTNNVATLQNCYIAIPSDSTEDCYSSLFTGVINQGSTDATSNTEATDVNLQSVAYSTVNFENVTSGTEDLRIKQASVLFDAGSDLTSSGVTEDLVGTLRPDGDDFDIGAFELVAIRAFVKNITAVIEPNLEITAVVNPTVKAHATAGNVLNITSTIGLA